MEKAEDTSIQAEPIVKSPSRKTHLRKGRGFSLGEIKAAGKNVQMIKKLRVRIDFFRKSVLESNVEQLKKLKAAEKKAKKRAPFVRREKKVRVKKKKEKKKVKPIEKVKVLPKEPAVKATPIAKQKVKPRVKTKEAPEVIEQVEKVIVEKVPPIEKETLKKKEKPKKKEKVKKEEEGTSLTKLSGLGAASEKKFKEVGVNNIEELLTENPEELAMLISGISAERIKKWIDEGKELLNK